MRIDPLDRLHTQQPVPGEQPPVQAPDPDFITDNPDVQEPDGPADRPGIGPDIQDPGRPGDPNEPGLGNPIP